jgi:predicted Zn-dependent protease
MRAGVRLALVPAVVRALALVLFATSTVACTTLPELASSSSWRRWSSQHGGVLDDPTMQARADRALAPLLAVESQLSLAIRVLDDDDAAAFAWARGDLFVTRGLVELLDERELLAAVAHEVGHLVARTRGDRDPRDEAVADAIGRELLVRVGVAPEAMTRMLLRLESQSRPVLAQRLRERMRRLAHGSAIADPASAAIAMN